MFSIDYHEILYNYLSEDFSFYGHQLNEKQQDSVEKILWILFKKDSSKFLFFQTIFPDFGEYSKRILIKINFFF